VIRRFEDGDIVTSGRQFSRGKDAVAQGVYHRLRMFYGEYFLNVADGTPWFQAVLGKSPEGLAEVLIKERIISAPKVIGISEFRFEPDAAERRIGVQASIVTSDNEVAPVLLAEEIV